MYIYAVRGTVRCLVYFSNLLPFLFFGLSYVLSSSRIFDITGSRRWQQSSTVFCNEVEGHTGWLKNIFVLETPLDVEVIKLFLDSVSWLFFMSSIRTVSVSLFCLSVEIPRVGSQEWFYGNTAFPVLFLFKVLKENTWIKDLDFFCFFFLNYFWEK